MKDNNKKRYLNTYLLMLLIVQSMLAFTKLFNVLDLPWIVVFLPTVVSVTVPFIVKDVYVICASLYEETDYVVEKHKTKRNQKNIDKDKIKEITHQDEITELKKLRVTYENKIEEERIKRLRK